MHFSSAPQNVENGSRSRPRGRDQLLTPAHLRLESSIVVAYTTSQWLSIFLFCILLLLKLNNTLTGLSWWAIFAPMWMAHALYIPLQAIILLETETIILRQIGPPPLETASTGLHLQYKTIRSIRIRSHVIDACNGVIDSMSMLVVKLVFCWCLSTGSIGPIGVTPAIPLRIVFVPLWISWVLCTLISLLKSSSERVFGSTRDLLYIFLIMVACKVDNVSSLPWGVVFVIPWVWLSSLLLLACVVLVLLLLMRVWRSLHALVLPMGFFTLLLSTMPQFISYVNLVRLLEGGSRNVSNISYESILVPNAVSWFAMWLSSWIVAYGLKQKEKLRDALVASGAVWTRHEQGTQRLHHDRDSLRDRIDRMTDEEIAHLVDRMMLGKVKPKRLLRVGNTLFKRVSIDEDFVTEQQVLPNNFDYKERDVESGADYGADSQNNITPRRGSGLSAGQMDSEWTLKAIEGQPHQGGSGEGQPSGNTSNMENDGISRAWSASCLNASPLCTSEGKGKNFGSCDLQALGTSQGTSAVFPDGESYTMLPNVSIELSEIFPSNGTIHQRGGEAANAPSSEITHSSTQVNNSRQTASLSRASVSQQMPTQPIADVNINLPDSSLPSQYTQMMNSDSSFVRFQGGTATTLLMRFMNEGMGNDPGILEASGVLEADGVDDLCIICCDQPPSCVFLECGHGGFCRRCAFLLFVRPPNECPTCRQEIDQVVELTERPPIGSCSKTK